MSCILSPNTIRTNVPKRNQHSIVESHSTNAHTNALHKPFPLPAPYRSLFAIRIGALDSLTPEADPPQPCPCADTKRWSCASSGDLNFLHRIGCKRPLSMDMIDDEPQHPTVIVRHLTTFTPHSSGLSSSPVLQLKLSTPSCTGTHFSSSAAAAMSSCDHNN